MRVKASKDLDQAASLIAYLGKNDSGLLSETWEELIRQGPGWKSRAVYGLAALKERYPDLDTSALLNCLYCTGWLVQGVFP